MNLPNEPTPETASGAPLSRKSRAWLGAIAALVLVATGMAVLQEMTRSRDATRLRPPRMTLQAEPRPLPPLDMRDAKGERVPLERFRGKVVLLNVWATWCGPCRVEMPTLERLQARLGGPGFEVVALSTDVGGAKAVREFYDSLGIERLAIYVEGEGNVLTTLGSPGLPTTLVVDAEGREVARALGGADWEAPEVERLIRSLLPAGAAN
ncbi:MAG: TlpA family protein disulfide reductase [Burkholderiales bacterium]|nr:TlpA family protein disulfide reductase [Burkholderiales bacterium]